MHLPIRITSAMTYSPFLEQSFRIRIADHLKNLPIEDRYLRFCSTLKDEAIDNYVNKIDFERDGVLAVFDEKSSQYWFEPIVGFLHAGPFEDGKEVEFGISVSPSKRNEGIASALFQSALVFAKSRGFKIIYMNCLYENKIMRHIVSKYGFDIESDFEEVTAKLKIDSKHVIENTFLDIANNNLAIFDLAYRSKIHQAKEWLQLFSQSK